MDAEPGEDAGTGEIVIIAGPNGAGKTTFAREYLPAGTTFVNADLIAAGLVPMGPSSTDFRAGRIMLERLDALARAGRSFAFETTLAGRHYARRIERWRASGYVVELVFLELPSPEIAAHRVRERVRKGGHDIPEAVIHRRFHAGLRNFRGLYCQTVDSWQRFDNSGFPPKLLEEGSNRR